MAHATVSCVIAGAAAFSLALVCGPVASSAQTSGGAFDTAATNHATQMLKDGRKIFRFETFGSEAFWGDTLELHKAIAGAKNGGVGPGVSPKAALAVGLKVDADALPEALKAQIKAGKVNLDDPATTIALLKANAVVGVTAFANPNGSVRSMGIQCAFCHSPLTRSFASQDMSGGCCTVLVIFISWPRWSTVRGLQNGRLLWIG